MIKVSVFYPKTDASTFDMAYYLTRHMPMVKQTIGAALKDSAVEQGLAGATPESAPLYAAMGHLYFESVEAFERAFAAHGAAIVADVPNYTNVQPLIQISEVKLGTIASSTSR